MIKRFYFFSISLFLFIHCAISQTEIKEDFSKYRPEYKYQEKDKKNAKEKKLVNEKIEIVKPTHHVNDEVDTMLVKIKRNNENFIYAHGHRVQVYSGNDMTSAANFESRVKSHLNSLGLKHSVYRNYSAPTWKVRVGDFLEEIEAYRLYHKLKKKFSNVLVVPDSKVLIKKIK